MKEWFLARGSNKYGPFTVSEVILLRQQGKAYESDLAWKQGLRQWKPLIQIDEFSAHAMAEKILKSESPELFKKREHQRQKIELPVIVHNEDSVWHAKTVNLSLGGVLLDIENPFLKPGDLIHINFQGFNESDQRFSCLGMITGKRFTNERLRFNTSIQYTVRFDSKDKGLDQQIEKYLKTILVDKQKAA